MVIIDPPGPGFSVRLHGHRGRGRKSLIRATVTLGAAGNPWVEQVCPSDGSVAGILDARSGHPQLMFRSGTDAEHRAVFADLLRGPVT